MALLASLASPAAGSAAELAADARLIVVALDAIPYDAALAFTRGEPSEAAPLADLEGPVPLVSSFPSSTSVALTAILSPFGLAPPPGYENKFFDRDLGRVRGGTLGSYGKIRFDWHHFFDWQLRGFFKKSRAYAKPLKYNLREVDRALAAFESSGERVFFAYVNSTDATGHTHGPAALEETFVNLDARLRELRRRLDSPLHVVLFSDHGLAGGERLENARPGVQRALRSAGWKPGGRLGKPRSVVLTPFGLVSSFEAYTHPGDEPDVARALAAETGVDLCAYRQGRDRFIVVGREGSAAIERRGDEWSYRPDDADPLGYADVAARLAASGGRYQADEAWFRETAGESYPDALYRIAGGFELVENPASVLCSVADGYLFGSKWAAFAARFSVGRLRWTHGALGRAASLGFLMTDLPGWRADGAVRFDRALDFLAERLAEAN